MGAHLLDTHHVSDGMLMAAAEAVPEVITPDEVCALLCGI
jgi:hypothetical protein